MDKMCALCPLPGSILYLAPPSDFVGNAFRSCECGVVSGTDFGKDQWLGRGSRIRSRLRISQNHRMHQRFKLKPSGLSLETSVDRQWDRQHYQVDPEPEQYNQVHSSIVYKYPSVAALQGVGFTFCFIRSWGTPGPDAGVISTSTSFLPMVSGPGAPGLSFDPQQLLPISVRTDHASTRPP